MLCLSAVELPSDVADLKSMKLHQILRQTTDTFSMILTGHFLGEHPFFSIRQLKTVFICISGASQLPPPRLPILTFIL